VLVHPADVHYRRAAEAVLADLRGRYPEVECLFADMGYQGLATWLAMELLCSNASGMAITVHPAPIMAGLA
jgi:hypothetical protein